MVWGVLGLYRSTGPAGFTATDAELIGSLSETVALGLRHSLITTTLEQASAAECGPAVIVVGADNQVQQVTPSARQRIGELGALPMPLLAINKLRDTRAVATRYASSSTRAPSTSQPSESGSETQPSAICGTRPNPPISVPRPDGRRRGEGWVGCERLGVIGSAPSAP